MSIVSFFCLKFIHSCYPIFPLQKMDWNLHYFFMRTSSNVWAWPSREGFKVEAKTRLSRRSIKVKQPQVSKRPMSLQIFEQRKKDIKQDFILELLYDKMQQVFWKVFRDFILIVFQLFFVVWYFVSKLVIFFFLRCETYSLWHVCLTK
jgi:hypothetical protein